MLSRVYCLHSPDDKFSKDHLHSAKAKVNTFFEIFPSFCMTPVVDFLITHLLAIWP